MNNKILLFTSNALTLIIFVFLTLITGFQKIYESTPILIVYCLLSYIIPVLGLNYIIKEKTPKTKEKIQKDKFN